VAVDLVSTPFDMPFTGLFEGDFLRGRGVGLGAGESSGDKGSDFVQLCNDRGSAMDYQSGRVLQDTGLSVIMVTRPSRERKK
jgi:hypothetical protein